MKIEFDDDMIIYLSNMYIKNVDFKDRNLAEEYINRIIEIYKIDLCGYLDIKIYIDKFYGAVILIKKDDGYYLDYFNDDITMNIEVIDSVFLYKTDDIYFIKDLFKYSEILEYDASFYIKPFKLSDLEIGKLVENCDLIFGDIVGKILNNGKKVNEEVIV